MYFKKLPNNKFLETKYNWKYKSLFWNQTWGIVDAPITHKIDYIPESWTVSHVSGLQKNLVYDSASLYSYYKYYNPKKIFLQSKQMLWDRESFPTLKRNNIIYYREYTRIQWLKNKKFI